MNWMKTSVAALGLALVSAPVYAQPSVNAPVDVDAGNLVTVDLTVVAQNIANNLNVEVSQIPVTVQVPISVAANVCNTEVNILATDGGGQGATCTAESTSDALTRIVQRRM